MYDIIADWGINKFCNFRCEYCFIQNSAKQNSIYKGHDITKIINGFNKFGKIFWIHMSGGEPFLQPNFVELCEMLTKKHYISINTNLSMKNIYEFAERIDPKRVILINCSLHFNERERKNLVNDFIEKYHYLTDKGFNIYATQVLYPPILQRFDDIFRFFKENGIILIPKVFIGMYRYKYYPQEYTKEDRSKILKYIMASSESSKELGERSEIHQFCRPDILEKELIYGDLSFKGLPCGAGKDLVAIEYNGDIIRCAGERTKIGNLFEGKINLFKDAKFCSARICPCPYHGLVYAKGKPEIVKVSIKDMMVYTINKFL